MVRGGCCDGGVEGGMGVECEIFGDMDKLSCKVDSGTVATLSASLADEASSVQAGCACGSAGWPCHMRVTPAAFALAQSAMG